MNDQQLPYQEATVEAWAAAFTYPPTPDIASAVLRRLQRPQRSLTYRLAWAALLLILIGGGLLAVPPVRAAVLEFLQIGHVRIWLGEATPVAPAETPPGTPQPTPAPVASLLDLAGERTLAQAQAEAGFPLRLPTYPPDLGKPDRIYRQDLGGSLVILVWLDTVPSRVKMSLTILGPGAIAEKQLVTVIEETTVNGKRAVWVAGEHLVQLQSGAYQMTRLVQGNTLIWSEDNVGDVLTYRLESDLSLAEAVKVAESLEDLSTGW